MKPPSFWSDPDYQPPRALLLAASLYQFFSQRRIARQSTYDARLPVICVGNVTMGGSGKTPIVQALAIMLREMDQTPGILLRGYGGRAKGPLWVKGQSAATVGDEALLHLGFADTVVARDRVRGAQMMDAHPSLTHIIMDDGLQNPYLHKDLSFLVVDGARPFGNEKLFPLGQLREPIDHAVKRSDALIIMGADKTDLTSRFQFLLPIFNAELKPRVPKIFAGLPIIAFAGIGNNDKFFTTLEEHDAILFEKISFPDHHMYAKADLQDLLNKAKKANLPLVTTRKDWTRLPSFVQSRVQVLDVDLQWHDEHAVRVFLKQKDLV